MKYLIWIIDDDKDFRDGFDDCFLEYCEKKQMFIYTNALGDEIGIKIYPALRDGSHIVKAAKTINDNDVPNIILLDLKFSVDEHIEDSYDPFKLSGVRIVLDGLAQNKKFDSTIFILFSQLKISDVKKNMLDEKYRVKGRILDFIKKQEVGFSTDFNISDKNCEAVKLIVDTWTSV